ncbi:uncharacterized protein LOC111801730 [Cucurbita pepo subsp. pepo]|uniref:uncharacterized protein LOC111801730 n=1 Tax=Cucurbita pepo subsp. pepo TaxID=3664 RepID=UPI000C9D5C5F|nr:uncharacterized protein LOC111801730 [Cucurbita pepo subsp. pepo]XP_023541620.1 uncharacterized protein LOC111801730 [Cucurbita pepo subsp. pepo]
MQCALEKSSEFQKVPDKGKQLLEVKIQEDNCSRRIKDSEVSSFEWRNFFDYRSAVISILTLESDGLWRIVALPLQGLDSLHVSCLPQMNQFTADRKLVHNGPASNGTYSVNSFNCRSLLESNKNLLVDSKAFKSSNKASSKFSWRSSCSSSALISGDSSAVSDIPIGEAKIQRYGKKNSRKKAKKRDIECKKTSSDFVSAETEVSSEDSARGSSLLEAFGNNGSDCRDGSVLCLTAREPFPSDTRASKNDFKRDSERIIQPLGTTDSISSEIVEGDASEVPPSATKNSSGDYNGYGSENQPLIKAPGCTRFDGEVDRKERLFNGCCNDFCSKDSFDNNSPDSNCDSHTLKLTENEGFGIDLLEGQNSPSRENDYSHHNSVRDEVDVNAEAEKANHGIQGCTASETRLILPGKKTKQNKKLSGNSRTNRFGGMGSSQRCTGKENSRTVWQKVQKNNSGGCCAQVDQVSPPVSKQLKGICNPVGVQTPKVKDKKTGNRKQLKDKFSKRLKNKNTSEQDKIYRPSKSSSGSNTNSMAHNRPNERLDIPAMGFDISKSSSGSRAPFQNDSADKCTTSESSESTQVCLDGSMSDKLISDGLNNQRVENESSTSLGSCSSLNQSNPLKAQSPVYVPHLFFQATKGSSLAERSKHSNQSRSPLQNWVPSVAEGSRLTTALARPDFSSLKDANKQPAEFGISEKSIQESVDCNLLDPVSNVIEAIQHSRDGNHDPLEKECEAQESHGHDTNALQDRRCELDVDEHFNCKSTCGDATRIEQVVNSACKAQLAFDAVHQIAEFERFLHLSSPVISQRPNLRSCEICSKNSLGDGIPCSHKTANISLSCLWQWYEKHGSYGLEVKANGHEGSNGFGADNSEFHAYFVPFLSAVQLFKSHKTHSGATTCPVGLDSRVSDIKANELPTSQLPIFSVLFPKPCTDDANVLQACSQLHGSEEPLASDKRNFSEQSVDSNLSGESELIFEYFEEEQPQQRRPLFDKIRQLVKGDGCLRGKIYGDPTVLESVTLNDLHAGSWYSVAWYPIYRIPDGNLRAAFLTYHSLGHFVCRTSQSSSSETDSCIVCPAVGLQSHNAQNECWFKPRNSTSTFNPPGVVDERLRTLEETASLMARAVVKKGNLNARNRHPDYEFFLSRRC